MAQIAPVALNSNVIEGTTEKPKQSRKSRRQQFWDRGMAFPSRLVDNMKDLEKLYRLRYDVYCEQKGFLNPSDYPNRVESDEFDQYSLHFGAFDDFGNVLGTLRLVRHSAIGFPMLDHCKVDVPDRILSCTGEISRLAVSKAIRKRREDGEYGMALDGDALDQSAKQKKRDNRRRHRPDVVVGLYKSLYQESKMQGITHWIAAMEPGLLKLLQRFYFNFESIGPEVDYYGPVRPYMVSLEALEDQVYKSSKPFYASFVKGLPQDMIRHPL